MYYTEIIIFFCFLIAVYDICTYRIPDLLLLMFLLFMLLLGGNRMNENITHRLLVSTIVLFLFSAVWYFSKGLGLGDVKYAALLGFLLTPEYTVKVLFTTALLGLVVFMTGIFIFKWSKETKIPYAPFLSMGAIFAVGWI